MSTFPYVKTCLYCGVPFEGRRNAKFCLPTHKALYHAEISRGKKQHEKTKYQRYQGIVDTLVKNCEIIDKLKEEGFQIVDKDEFLIRGFKFNHYTHLSQRGEHNTIRWFDNGLKILGDNKYEIIA